MRLLSSKTRCWRGGGPERGARHGNLTATPEEKDLGWQLLSADKQGGAPRPSGPSASPFPPCLPPPSPPHPREIRPRAPLGPMGISPVPSISSFVAAWGWESWGGGGLQREAKVLLSVGRAGLSWGSTAVIPQGGLEGHSWSREASDRDQEEVRPAPLLKQQRAGSGALLLRASPPSLPI